ncbi:MAG: NAD-dependent epimerase/dehydratase, partial [Bacteroidetes bacterium]|nr:NAD-dependent epimerase/dehydratase [Bacteroidota bacterium]
MKHIGVITGATGYIGSHLLKYLLQQGWEIHIIVQPEIGYSNIEDVKNRICLFEYNMTNGDISPTIGGAAIFIKSASPIMTNSTFRNNTGTTECSILSLY